jgi:hypothetical protein
MKWEEFTRQMERLIANYGKTAYSDERIKLIWKEVNELDARRFETVVDRFIGEFRQPPLMHEFREELSHYREKNWHLEKEKHRVESERAIKAVFDGQFIESICKDITDRLEGKVSDEIFTDFVRGIGKLAGVRCSRCEDSGLVWQTDESRFEWVYRCYCPEGERQSK